MLRKLFGHGSIYILSVFITRGISLILLPFYTRVLSTSDYGIIDILSILTNLAGLTIAFEINQSIARYYNEQDDSDYHKSITSTVLWFSISVYSIFFLFGFLFKAKLAELILNDPVRTDIIILFLCQIWTYGLFIFLQTRLRYALKPLFFALTSISFTLVSASVTIVCVLVFKQGVAGVITGLICGQLTGIILSFFFIRHDISLSIDFLLLKKLLMFSAPLVPSSMGVFVSLYVDRFVIKETLSFSELGIYGVSARISAIIGLVMIGFNSAITPLIYANYKSEQTKFEISNIFSLFIIASLIMFLSLSFFSPEIMYILTTPEYYSAMLYVPMLVAASFFSSMYMFSPGLSIAGKTFYIALISIATALIAAAMNILLVPRLGLAGAAAATLSAAIVSALLNIFFSQKFYLIPIRWPKIISAMLISGALVAILFKYDFVIQLSIIIKLLVLTAIIPLLSIIIEPRIFSRIKSILLSKLSR